MLESSFLVEMFALNELNKVYDRFEKKEKKKRGVRSILYLLFDKRYRTIPTSCQNKTHSNPSHIQDQLLLFELLGIFFIWAMLLVD